MWQEARKNEKKIKSLMVDHKKRVERAKDFYDKIRRDPVEFLQVHASAVRIHIDSSISASAENCLMPWRGDTSNMIDRFDARAHLEEIPAPGSDVPALTSSKLSEALPEPSPLFHSRLNYERWKNLVHYEFSGSSENKVLHQIFLDERSSSASHPLSKYQQQQNQAIKKKSEPRKAAIGYNYDTQSRVQPVKDHPKSSSSEDSDIESSKKEPAPLDPDTCPHDQILKLNSIAQKHSILGDDFVKFMQEDKNEAERIQIAKDIENEKSMFAGRKSRRERKALKERRMLILRSTSAPLECKQTSHMEDPTDSSSSESDGGRKCVPKTEFITSFGGSTGEESDHEQAAKFSDKKKSFEHKNWSEVLPVARSRVHDKNGKECNSRDSDVRRGVSRDKSSKNRNRSRSRERTLGHKSSQRNRTTRSRSRSRGSSRHSKSRNRSRSRSRSRRRRSRSVSRDRFGRIRRSCKSSRSSSPTPSCTTRKPSPIAIVCNLTPQSCAPLTVAKVDDDAKDPEIEQQPPPPPLKRYYRHDLESDGSPSDSDHEKEEKEARVCDQQAVSASCTRKEQENKVKPSGSSKSSSRIHRILMKKTRTQIESHYRKDKRMQEEKSKLDDSKRSDDSRRRHHSSRHRRSRSSSTSS